MTYPAPHLITNNGLILPTKWAVDLVNGGLLYSLDQSEPDLWADKGKWKYAYSATNINHR